MSSVLGGSDNSKKSSSETDALQIGQKTANAAKTAMDAAKAIARIAKRSGGNIYGAAAALVAEAIKNPEVILKIVKWVLSIIGGFFALIAFVLFGFTYALIAFAQQAIAEIKEYVLEYGETSGSIDILEITWALFTAAIHRNGEAYTNTVEKTEEDVNAEDEMRIAEDEESAKRVLQKRIDMIQARIEKRVQQYNSAVLSGVSLSTISEIVTDATNHIIQNADMYIPGALTVAINTPQLTDLEAVKLLCAYSIQHDCDYSSASLSDIADWLGCYTVLLNSFTSSTIDASGINDMISGGSQFQFYENDIKTAYKYLMDGKYFAAYTPGCAIGITSIMLMSSYLNPTATGLRSDGTQGSGLLLWSQEGLTKMQSICTNNDISSDTMQGQLWYFKRDLRDNHSALQDMLCTFSMTVAEKEWGLERPLDENGEQRNWTAEEQYLYGAKYALQKYSAQYAYEEKTSFTNYTKEDEEVILQVAKKIISLYMAEEGISDGEQTEPLAEERKMIYTSVAADGLENALFPMEAMNVYRKEGGEAGDVHRYTYALDLTGSDNSIQNVFAPFTMTIRRISTEDGTNTVWAQSVNKVHFADGTIDYMCMMCRADDYIGDLRVGDFIQQGVTFYQEGTEGTNGEVNYVHIEFGSGRFEDPGYTLIGEDNHVVINNHHHFSDAVFTTNETKLLNTGDYEWRQIDCSTDSIVSVDSSCVVIGDGNAVRLCNTTTQDINLSKTTVLALDNVGVLNMANSQFVIEATGKTIPESINDINEETFKSAIIMLGTNDLAYSDDSFQTKYNELIKLLYEKNTLAELCICTILPVNRINYQSSGGTLESINNEKINEKNAVIKKIYESYKEKGYRIRLIDINKQFKENDGTLKSIYDSKDGVHLNQKGYERLNSFIIGCSNGSRTNVDAYNSGDVEYATTKQEFTVTSQSKELEFIIGVPIWMGTFMPQYLFEQRKQDNEDGVLDFQYRAEGLINEMVYVARSEITMFTEKINIAEEYKDKNFKKWLLTACDGAVYLAGTTLKNLWNKVTNDEDSIKEYDWSQIGTATRVSYVISVDVVIRGMDELSDTVIGFWDGPLSQHDSATGKNRDIETGTTNFLRYSWTMGGQEFHRIAAYQMQGYKAMVQQCAAELGIEVTFGSGNGNNIVAVAINEYETGQGANNGAKYNGGTGSAWCCSFVYYCADQCGYIGEDKCFGPQKTGGCPTSWNSFTARGQTTTDSSYRPQPGDLVYYQRAGASEPCHIGIVEYVDDNNRLHTIEGNVGNTIFRGKICNGFSAGTYAWSNSNGNVYIKGYAIPQYPSDIDNVDENSIFIVANQTTSGSAVKEGLSGDVINYRYGVPRFTAEQLTAVIDDMSINYPSYHTKLEEHEIGSEEFMFAWAELGAEDDVGFRKAQIDIAYRLYVQPLQYTLKADTGLPFDTDKALGEMSWAMFARDGQNAVENFTAAQIKKKATTKDVIETYYSYMLANYKTIYEKHTMTAQENMKLKLNIELERLIALTETEDKEEN